MNYEFHHSTPKQQPAAVKEKRKTYYVKLKTHHSPLTTFTDEALPFLPAGR
jgi:hypothetical protein